MAFIVYFFVLLVAASSVLFALDWVNAPLQLPAPAERTQVANSTKQNKPEPFAQQQPPAVTPSARSTQGANSATQTKPEPVAQQEPPAPTPSTPPESTQAANSTTAQQQLSNTETTRAAVPEKLKAHAKRKRRTSPQSAASARAQSLPRAERRGTERAPSWAIRGAEAARREAEQSPQRAPVQPSGGPFRPFWESEGGWHFR